MPTGIRRNGLYNDPALGQAFSNLGKMFAPPDAADYLASARATAEREKASRLSELFAYAKDPANLNAPDYRARRDALAIGAGVYAPTQSDRAVDLEDATKRRGQDVVARTAVDTEAMRQRGETLRSVTAPLSEGQTRASGLGAFFGAPGLPENTRGVVKLNPGQRAALSDGSELQGNAASLTDEQLKAAIIGQMPTDQQQAWAFGSTPVENVVGEDGLPRIATRPAAIGQRPALDPAKDTRPAQAHSIRQEIAQLASRKNLEQAAPIYAAMAATEGTNSKASDLNLIYGLGKVFDPTSVVREGELEMAKNTAGWGEKLQGAFSAIQGGAALTPDTRAALLAEAYGRVKAYEDRFAADQDHYAGIADRAGINRADVLPNFTRATPYQRRSAATGDASTAGAAPISAAPAMAMPPGMPAPAPVAPPAGAVAHLRANPDLAPAFDEKFGQGAAASVLGRR